jgi:hypothetical protein
VKKYITFLNLILIFMLVSLAEAIPTLQLDIQGGTYVNGTILSNGNQFTLYAYLIPDSNALLSDTYYISAAVVPIVGSSQVLGSFSFNGTPISVTSGMVYGTPPIETIATQLHDPGDLSTHQVFDTYFTERPFTFDQDKKATEYNTQDNTGAGPTPNPLGTMYFKAFTIDTSLLNPNYFIHFDLYNTEVANGGDVDRCSFAPFSHDAQSNGHSVPEPSVLLLLGSGLLGFALYSRKRFKK